jgi:predicted transposase/invertase (TIGR01784 family)
VAQKDVISKQTIKRMAVDIAVYLLHLSIDTEDVEVLETEQQRVEYRRADLVVRLKSDGEPFILHVEIQNANEPQMPLRMMRYYTDIALAHPQLPIKQYLMYIGKHKLTMPDQVETADWTYRYTLVDMHSVDCNTLISLDNPDALILAILCDFKGQNEQQVVNYLICRLHQLLKENESRLQDYLFMLNVLSENRDLQQCVKKAGEMLTEVNIENLPFYQLVLEKGWERGVKKGMTEGFEQGIEQGIEQGVETIVRKLLRQQSPEIIAQLIDLPLEKVLAIQNKVEH